MVHRLKQFAAALCAVAIAALAVTPAGAQSPGRLRFGRPITPVSYPPGVVAAGLQAVWNLRSTAGATLSPTLVMPTNSASLPSGSAVTTSPNQVFLPLSGTPTLAGWNWNNYNPVVRGGVNLNTFTQNVMTANDGSGRLLKVGNDDAVGGTALADYVTFDALGISNVNAGATQIDSNSSLTIRHSRLVNASHINLKAFGAAVVEDSWLGAYCLNPPGGAHCESAFFSSTTSLLRVLVDNTDAAPLGGQTGPLYFEADVNGNLVATMDSVIVNWPSSMALLGTMQVAAKNGKTLQLTVRNSVLKRGSNTGSVNRYFVITQVTGGVVTIIDGGGNFDLETGAPINVTYP